MDDGAKKPRGRGRGAARGRGRGKGRGRGRGRNAKAAAIVESDDEQMQLDDAEDVANKSLDEANSKSPAAADSAAESTAVPGAVAPSTAAIDDASILAGAEAPALTGTPTIASTSPEVGGGADPAPDAVSSVAQLPLVVAASLPSAIDMEADISQLEAPTFTTLSRGPPEPMTRLKWDHKVNLIGEKVLNPMIHCCDQCENVKPILIYGRMLPCKHVFCLKCGREEPCPKQCPRCKEKVLRVEQSGLGTVFMCTNGGSRYGTTGCRRTYLSQRDLLAHINHRHVTAGVPAAGAGKVV